MVGSCSGGGVVGFVWGGRKRGIRSALPLQRSTGSSGMVVALDGRKGGVEEMGEEEEGSMRRKKGAETQEYKS